MIEVSGLTKKYGERLAIDKLSFSIKAGEVVGLLGPNGAGKSTTMKILTGYMSPTSGTAKVCGFEVFSNPLEVKKRIGYLPENPPLYMDMIVCDYLKYAAQLKGVDQKQVDAYVEDALEKTQLTEVRNRIIKNLSKGFKQRVGIAQAIVSKPQVLILDEPTVGLDPKQVTEIRDLINSLKSHHTIIISTHILSEVEATCSKIIIIHQGKIVAQDSIENIHNLSKKSGILNMRIKIEKPDLVQKLKSLSGVERVEQMGLLQYQLFYDEKQFLTENVLKCLLDSGAGLAEWKESQNSLEEAFLSLTYNSDNRGVSS